jgi:hypothetical protein
MKEEKTIDTAERNHEQEDVRSGGQFFIDRVQIARKQTIFYLNQAKPHGGQWFNQVVFDYNEGLELKQIMMSLFQEGRPFDFNIVQPMADNRCKIDTIIRCFGRLADQLDTMEA